MLPGVTDPEYSCLSRGKNTSASKWAWKNLNRTQICGSGAGLTQPHPMEKLMEEYHVPIRTELSRAQIPCDFGKKPQLTEYLCEGKGSIAQIIVGESHKYQLHPHKSLQNKDCRLYTYFFPCCINVYRFQ